MPDWGEIVAREGRTVWRTAYRLLGDSADADECFQEAFLDALEIAGRGEVRNWGALLRRLATARAVDRLRRKIRREGRRDPTDCDALPAAGPSPQTSAEDAELAERLRAALGVIPARQAEAFYLHCLEDWSYREIAGRLSISTGLVGVLVHRVRNRLRVLLGGDVAPVTQRKERP